MSKWMRTLAIVVAAWTVGVAPASEARTPERPETNDFIIRAPASEIDSIAARNGLEVLDQINVSPDAQGRSVYLVRAPDSTSPELVKQLVNDYEPDAMGIEEVFLASLPETYEGLDLDQSTMAILGALEDDRQAELWNDGKLARLAWHGYVEQPAIATLRISEAHQLGILGEAIVAIIDTGVDPDHPLFADRLLPGYDFIREEYGSASEWADVDQSTMAILGQSTMAILGNEEVLELNQSTMAILGDEQVQGLDLAALPPAFGHGTMVAGIVHRVAPKAWILPLRAFDGDGRGSVFDVVRAVYYAVERGANVINMSFSLETFSPELLRAVNYATRRGITCVASVGNEGAEAIVYPAAFGNAIGVASTSGTGTELSLFSNLGSDLVTIAAPGENLVTTYPGGGWALASGTSFAAPWISGLAALFADRMGHQDKPYYWDAHVTSFALSRAEAVSGHGAGKAGHGRADASRALDWFNWRKK